ncbi:hypothetical protein EVAR_7507_1 [Eumeta japonica]|uniref:Uncharacterized protein n=1 Tax=Eumeta variegata TaxID=151549 RepID=A0A4C1Y403_EUMVA|nr:hypothetical protein EVAR_7507_1 [Eumeta japonica]
MAWGLPKLPGMTFSDPTRTRFHLQSSLKYCQGYRCPEVRARGTGGAPTDADSNAFTAVEDSIKWIEGLAQDLKVKPTPARRGSGDADARRPRREYKVRDRRLCVLSEARSVWFNLN